MAGGVEVSEQEATRELINETLGDSAHARAALELLAGRVLTLRTQRDEAVRLLRDECLPVLDLHEPKVAEGVRVALAEIDREEKPVPLDPITPDDPLLTGTWRGKEKP